MNRPIPMSQQQMMSQRMGMSNFQQSFDIPTPLIDKPDFTNYGNVLHNNLSKKLLLENVVEYKIHINSADRNRSSDPSPFKLRISFGSGLSSPSIMRRFKNIKYITVDSVILPRTIAIDTTHIADPNLYPTSSKYIIPPATDSSNIFTTLTNRRYLILRIKELNTDNTLGTSTIFDRDTFMLTNDSSMGIDNVLWKPVHNYRIVYPNSLLNNISKLTLELLDENGNELQLVNEVGAKIIGTSILTGSDYNKFVNDNITVNSIAYTDAITQVMYNLTFGVIENELATETNY